MKKLALLFLLSAALSPAQGPRPAWRALPEAEPAGERAHTGAHVVADRSKAKWKRPTLRYDEAAATGRKEAKVVVLVYNPRLKSQGGKSLIEHLKANDPLEYSRILADVVREASWGYINYRIVDVIEVDGYAEKVDGFRYTEETFLEVRRTQQWQPAMSSYRKILAENGLIERCRSEGITEIWLWGAGGMHFDEFAGYIPNRYARFGPTENPWFYRPYDIPPELGRTTWVMGFNYEVGADNMIHSYAHRIESMAALALADGIWDPKTRDDPWNRFSRLEMDMPGTPSQVGNCHVPPNGQSGYDYNNPRRVLSCVDSWARYPDLEGQARPISAAAWGNSHFGYMKWLLERVPKFPGYTKHGYNNWWVYIANTDEELPERG